MYTEHLHIPVGVGTLHVERLGRGGPAVVLLHGFATCAFLWREVAPLLAAQGFTTVAIDLLGHGESDRPVDAVYTAAAQADCVERALTALRLGAVTVVAQDAGALVAVLLAAQRPSRVRSLLLLEPPDPGDLPGPAIRTLQRNAARIVLSANALFGARPLLEPWLTERLGARAEPERLLARYLAPFVGGTGAADLLQLASHIDLPDEERRRLRDVRVPTTLWLGRGGVQGAPRGLAPDGGGNAVSEAGDGGRLAAVEGEEPRPGPPAKPVTDGPDAAVSPGHSPASRQLLNAWAALLPASLVRALPMPTLPGALVAEVAPALVADAIRRCLEPEEHPEPAAAIEQ